jgi:hypothetical protein
MPKMTAQLYPKTSTLTRCLSPPIYSAISSLSSVGNDISAKIDPRQYQQYHQLLLPFLMRMSNALEAVAVDDAGEGLPGGACLTP